MASSTAEVLLGDGSVLTFEWAYPGAQEQLWVLDFEHYTEPMTPFELWCYRHCGAGIDRAWSEWGLVPPNVFIRWQFAGPFLYFCDSADSPERRASIAKSFSVLAAEFGSAKRFWLEWCEPRVSAVVDRLARGEDEPMVGFADAWGYGWHQTFTSYTAPDLILDELIAMLEAVLGAEGALLAQEMAQGGGNASQALDAEVWDIAQMARLDDGLTALVTTGSPVDALAAARADPGAQVLVSRLDALVARHYARSEGWDVGRPTWGERPDLVLALVRSQMNGGVTPDEVARRSMSRRDVAVTRAFAVLPAADHGRCRALLVGLDGYVAIREARAYWQMTLTGQLRLLALRLGRCLVQDGRIRVADDVLFLEPPEFEGTTGWLGDLVASRRAEWVAWRSASPPPQIGAVGPDPEAPVTECGGDLLGIAASRGVVTGTARVILDPDDWDRLEPGDILVCPMSTPTWTPLFAVAGGLVTESGNAYAHPAITAREYGIPAVVAVTGACSRILDGQIVTVDGTGGRVGVGGLGAPS